MNVNLLNIVKTSANTGFASGGVMCKLGVLCFVSSVVQVDSFVLRKPARTQSPKMLCEMHVLLLGYRPALKKNLNFVFYLLERGIWCFLRSATKTIYL